MTTTPQHQAEQQASAALTVVQQELEALDGWTVDSDEDNAFAAEMLQDVKQRHKRLETERKKITKPMNAALRAVNDLFRKPREALEQAERLIKGEIAAYLEAREEANTAAFEAAADAETVEEASAALASVEDASTPAGVSVRYKWRAVVVAEDLLMPQFLSPDRAKIEAWASSHKGPDGEPLPIPGVRFDREPIVSSRAVK